MPPSRRTPNKPPKVILGSERRIQTRSETKRESALNGGALSTDNTRLGVPTPTPPSAAAANPAPPTLLDVATLDSSFSSSFSSSSSSRSYNSLFDGSLSSISSASSADLDDEPRRADTPTPNPGIPIMTGITTGPRPLQRAEAHVWRKELRGEVIVEGALRPKPGPPPRIRYTPDEIFERASKNLHDDIRYRQSLVATRVLENAPTMNEPAEEIYLVAPASNLTLDQPGTRALGPEGTVIFDEDEDEITAPPLQPGVFPEKWVLCKSTSLRQYPTEEW